MAVYDHWMRLHVGDYLADTMHLSALQHGIYLLLIMHYFKRGELPPDAAALRQIAKVSARQWRSNASAVLALFQVDTKGQLRHKRADAERDLARTVSEARAHAGKRGAAAKWGWQLPSDDDGNCLTRAPPRARDSHNHNQEDPPIPPSGGADAEVCQPLSPKRAATNPRALGTNPRGNGSGHRANRNGMIDLIREEQEHAANGEADTVPRRNRARVVAIAGRLVGGIHDP